jgi:hypothetical protein
MKMKAFVNVMVASTWNSAIQNLVIGTGLGAMAPNMVVMSFEDLNHPSSASSSLSAVERGDASNKEDVDDDDDDVMPLLGSKSHHRRGSTWSHPPTLVDALTTLAEAKVPGAVQSDDGNAIASALPTVFTVSHAVGTLRDILWLRKAVVLTRGMEHLPADMRQKATIKVKISRSVTRSITSCCSKTRRTSALHTKDTMEKKKYIDLWHVFPAETLITPSNNDDNNGARILDSQLALRLQLAFIMAEQWGLQLRLFYVCIASQRDILLTELDALAYKTRINFAALVADVVDDPAAMLPDQLGARIAAKSGRNTPCAMAFLELPSPPSAGAVADVELDVEYMRNLDALTAVADLPAIALVRAATDRVVVTTEI